MLNFLALTRFSHRLMISTVIIKNCWQLEHSNNHALWNICC